MTGYFPILAICILFAIGNFISASNDSDQLNSVNIGAQLMKKETNNKDASNVVKQLLNFGIQLLMPHDSTQNQTGTNDKKGDNVYILLLKLLTKLLQPDAKKNQ